MDNKENWETPALAGVMEPIHNVAQARRRRPLDPDDLEVVKLTNLNRELRDQMEEDVARLQADLEALKCENARLQADGSAARRNCVEIRAELAQRTAQLAAKDK
jgi:ABC-type phosphate transport system auxiliary subunit